MLAEELWQNVYEHKDWRGPLGVMALFALALLLLQLSNADVEQALSLVNIIKSKLRNCMANKTLERTMHLRYALRRQNICCTDFTPTKCKLL